MKAARGNAYLTMAQPIYPENGGQSHGNTIYNKGHEWGPSKLFQSEAYKPWTQKQAPLFTKTAIVFGFFFLQ